MPMQLHELHPSLIHLPLALLPGAALTDALAATSRGRLRRLALDRVGRTMWWAGVGAAALAGVAGMAASQEVRADDPRARDAMWLHGAGNLGVLLAGAGLASWRSTHRVTATSATMGAAAVAAAVYTAWLGGELVYTHGVGVKAQPAAAANGARPATPPLRSWAAPGRMLADAGRGLAWLLRRGGRAALRKEPLAAGAATQPDRPLVPPPGGGAWDSQLRPIG
ncbi:DUF2231 domain-containing protein [Anaeromyxobacter diazotrophicus]|uniref:DUF2231 domain-containing protein n=1 Tax=Anaeromyxobacter diazotrophicus TaxID=2590199 RepID=A0A7I9VTB7_9BACT|nr:DUF2231 domain-containing protein [Anaeromyxobacter diazotrophicus]GEJ59551.1 hypothetical protein AMYX_42920 [Anaeromyxobacter diazotrophicus]